MDSIYSVEKVIDIIMPVCKNYIFNLLAYFIGSLNFMGINTFIMCNYYVFNIYRVCNNVTFLISDIGNLYLLAPFHLYKETLFIFTNSFCLVEFHYCTCFQLHYILYYILTFLLVFRFLFACSFFEVGA